MKLVTAIIQPDRLEAVREALIRAEIQRITVSRCTGRGRAQDTDIYRGQEVAPDLLPKGRVDIACNDDFVSRAVGDGKISSRRWKNAFAFAPASAARTPSDCVVEPGGARPAGRRARGWQTRRGKCFGRGRYR